MDYGGRGRLTPRTPGFFQEVGEVIVAQVSSGEQRREGPMAWTIPGD